MRPPPIDDEDMFDVEGRVEEDCLVDERLDVPVDGRVDAEGPLVDGRVDADGPPVDGRVDPDGPPVDGRAAEEPLFPDPLP